MHSLVSLNLVETVKPDLTARVKVSPLGDDQFNLDSLSQFNLV